jgi:threonylcarbamoyladenosine tRNA methylthiotransferase MtaB
MAIETEPMKKVALTTLGCKTNQFETAAMREALLQDGYELVRFTDSADLYVINTCTVTARTDAESRRMIRRAARLNPEARIVVTGCYAQLGADELKSLPGVTLVIGNSEKKRLVELLRETSGEEKSVVVTDIAAETGESLPLETCAEQTRAFLQIQNGCNAFCTYCIVPFARGRSRSVPFDEVLAGINRLSAKGFREIVLTGIHLGSYGLDLKPPSELLDLLMAVEQGALAERLRIGSVEPNEVSGQFIEFLAKAQHVCPHLHLPLQSGSDSVLERMGRHYSAADISRLVTNLTQQVPGISIGFDVIAGFPGESEGEHNATLQLIADLPVAYLHVFPYSSRPGTKAADMPGHLPPALVKKRAEEIRLLGERKKREFTAGFLQRELLLLVQGGGKNGKVSGLTRNYLTVNATGAALPAGSEQKVRITAVNADGSCEGVFV